MICRALVRVMTLITAINTHIVSASHAEDVSKKSLPTLQGGAWIYGTVVQIDRRGHLVLDTGEVVDPWGVTLVEDTRLDALLLAHSVFCRVLGVSNDVQIGDCNLVPGGARSSGADAMLNLFEWLPELGLATRGCTLDHIRATQPRFVHSAEVLYKCVQGVSPERKWATD
jgi:hypothetical protein